MKRKKSNKKTYAKPRMDEVQDENNIALVGLGLFLCFCRALENNSTEEMDRVLKKLDGWGLTIVKTKDGKYCLVKKEKR